LVIIYSTGFTAAFLFLLFKFAIRGRTAAPIDQHLPQPLLRFSRRIAFQIAPAQFPDLMVKINAVTCSSRDAAQPCPLFAFLRAVEFSALEFEPCNGARGDANK
jgi:hypothetical protein